MMPCLAVYLFNRFRMLSSSGNSDADNRRAVAAQLFDMLARMSTSVSIAGFATASAGVRGSAGRDSGFGDDRTATQHEARQIHQAGAAKGG